jgi:hypothetical protein
MSESTKVLTVLVSGWLLVTGTASLVLLGTQGAFQIASHDTRFGSLLWSLLGVIFVSGIKLLLAVHAYVSLVTEEAEEESDS